MTKLTLETLPIEILSEFQFFGMSPLKMMAVNKYFLNIFAPQFYGRIYCGLGFDFEVSKFSDDGPGFIDDLDNGSELCFMIRTVPNSPPKFAKNVTILSSEEEIAGFFSKVMIEGSYLRNFVRQITFDTIIIEGDFLRSVRTQPFFHYPLEGLGQSMLESALMFCPSENVFQRDLKKFTTRASDLKHSQTDHSPVFKGGRDIWGFPECPSRQMNLLMQMTHTLIAGNRFDADPDYNKWFSDVALRESDFSLNKDHDRELNESHAARVKEISSDIYLHNSKVREKSYIYSLLMIVLDGMKRVPKGCTAEFLGFVVNSVDMPTGNDSADKICEHSVKLMEYKSGALSTSAIIKNSPPDLFYNTFREEPISSEPENFIDHWMDYN